MKLQLSLLIACGLAFYSCSSRNNKNAYDTSSDLESIVAQIAAGQNETSSHIGIAASPSRQWELYNKLKNSATTEQLVELTDHNNSAVKCYSFQALAAKNSDQTFRVLLKNLMDTAKVELMNGCIVRKKMIGDYLLGIVTSNDTSDNTYRLNASERNIVDSILLHNNHLPLESKFIALIRTMPTPGNYNRIKELVENDRNETALIILARYQKKEDRKLIASFFNDSATQYSALFAVREYSDEYFYPFVKRVFENEWKRQSYDVQKWRMCYQTLAKFPNTETVALFERTMSTNGFRYNTLCVSLLAAIKKFPNKLYEPVKNKIKLSEIYIDAANEQMEDGYEKTEFLPVAGQF